MTLDRKKFSLALIAVLIVFNLLAFVSFLPWLRDTLQLLFLFFVPGLLIFSAIRLAIAKSLVNFLCIIGFSMGFLILGGLFINTIGPPLGISRPLETTPLALTYDVLLIIIGAVALAQHNNFSLPHFSKVRLGLWDVFSLALALIGLLLIMGGSQVLNNGGSGTLTFIGYIVFAAEILLTALLHKRIHSFVFPLTIFIFGFSMLLSFSLRSSYVFGWDINQEFYAFHLTEAAKHWSISAYRSPYNACMGITILPTVLSSLTHIGGNVLFKVVFQGMFAFVPVALYELAKRIFPKQKSVKLFSFLAAIVFSSQTWFIQQAPALVRQEVALLFFSLLLLVLFGTAKNKTTKSLGIFFGLMIILSHYSTAYVTIILFVLYIIIDFIFFRRQKRMLSFTTLVVFFLITFLWQYQLTSTAGGFNQTVKQTFTSLPQTFSEQGIGSSVAQVSFSNPNLNTQKNINNTYRSETANYRKGKQGFYAPASYRNYQATVAALPFQPPLLSGRLPTVLSDIGKISKILISDIFPLVGLIVVAVYVRKNRQKSKRRQYIVLALSSMLLIGLMLVLPLLKNDYNLTRLYLQSLIVFAPLIIIGGAAALSRLRHRRYLVIGLIAAAFLLYSGGVFGYVAGGSVQAVLTNNSSDNEMFYTAKGEVVSAKWIDTHHKDQQIYADQIASLKLMAHGGVAKTQDFVFPSTITKNSYVYETQSNLNGLNFHKYKDGQLRYSFPNQFLQSEKNNVYTNQNSKIYH